MRLSTPDPSFRVRKSHLSCLRHKNIQYIQNRPTRRRRISLKAIYKKREPPTDIPTVIQSRFGHPDSPSLQSSMTRVKTESNRTMMFTATKKDANLMTPLMVLAQSGFMAV